jgi:hypothetical protein
MTYVVTNKKIKNKQACLLNRTKNEQSETCTLNIMYRLYTNKDHVVKLTENRWI